MRIQFILLVGAIFMVSCGVKTGKTELQPSVPIAGTWKLLSGTLIEAGDTLVTDFTKNVSFIKIINATHFAFLQHDLKQGKDSAAVFIAGGGRYTLTDSLYTEHLEYCSDRAWEGNDFSFTVIVKNDTLIQLGVERLEEAGINRLNIEKYMRVAP
jgi:hypothetical protein